jgi:hypothetical protein
MPQGDYPELAAWSQVDPPASLDALVRQRANAVLERRRADAPPLIPARSLVPAGQRPGQALGSLTYAAQLFESATRLMRRAVTG